MTVPDWPLHSPVWIVVFDRDGTQSNIIRRDSEYEADKVLYHNRYYGYRCLRIRVKSWR